MDCYFRLDKQFNVKMPFDGFPYYKRTGFHCTNWWPGVILYYCDVFISRLALRKKCQQKFIFVLTISTSLRASGGRQTPSESVRKTVTSQR